MFYLEVPLILRASHIITAYSSVIFTTYNILRVLINIIVFIVIIPILRFNHYSFLSF